MKLRPLVIDDIAKAKIKAVVDMAEVHRLSVKDIFDIMGGRRNPPGDDPGFVCVLDFGYRCVYTIEQQAAHGWCRHLSVSVMGGPAPNPAAVFMLMGEFGFVGGFDDMLHVGKEEIGRGAVAINVMQKL
jgi:hypothetical protein